LEAVDFLKFLFLFFEDGVCDFVELLKTALC